MKIITTIILIITMFVFVPVNAQAITAFACHGTEPFWHLNISPNIILYQTPEAKPMTFSPVKPKAALGRPTEYMLVYKTKTFIKKQPVTIIIKHEKRGCSDGMSDIIYNYSTVLLINNDILVGCCDRRYQ